MHLHPVDLGALSVLRCVVGSIDQLLAGGGLGDLWRGGAGVVLVRSIIPCDVRCHDGILVVPHLAVNLEDLGYRVGVGVLSLP